MVPNSMVRRAKEKDVTALVRLSIDSFRNAFEPNNPKSDIDLYVEENFSFEQIYAQVLEPSNLFLLLFIEPIQEQTSPPVGYTKLRMGPPESCVTGENPVEIERFYLDASAIGKGFGSMLMRACLAEAEARCYQTVWLGVWEYNYRAITFYKRWGFTIVGSHPFQQGTETQTDLIMQRAISEKTLTVDALLR
ncbi:acetyltransferase, GNAT family [Synechococcus sp. PCC 7335]|uniref:GNAT family N-acetyltransferase n=1 Tax=Synechococcus sp. (strain ATCC 29403 / PCC 7335) TaxID=91464 RepID=UPI00017EB0C6|nr:GNAT family N-acetyltransferase [Synechococcus sp. PCC 7335]EDX83752.1 acetyltransferase, GNAT family [Synechococcus sp. PCC 7335]